MIDSYYSDYFLMPVNDFWISKKYSATHTGIDLGWHNTANAEIYPIQDGKVVDNFYSSSCGYTVVVQHDYSDGKHRFSAYLHMKEKSKLAIGTQVYSMVSDKKTVLGLRGTTGTSSGVHLHLYVTAKTTKAYTWTLIGHSYPTQICNFDPLPHLYVSNKITYALASDDSIKNYPVWEEIPEPVTYPEPVERNTKVKQVNILIDYLFMRKAPGGTAYDSYAKKGIYNIYKEEVSGSYCWYLIDTINNNEFWIASGGTRTEDLPAELSKEEVLQNKVDELEKKYKELEKSVADKSNRITVLEADLKASKEETEKAKATTNEAQNERQEALKKVELLTAKIINAVKELS